MTKKKSALFVVNIIAAARTWCLLYAKSYYFVNIEVY